MPLKKVVVSAVLDKNGEEKKRERKDAGEKFFVWRESLCPLSHGLEVPGAVVLPIPRHSYP